MLVQQFVHANNCTSCKAPHQFPHVSGNHRCLVCSTNKGQVMTSSILMKMFVCMFFVCGVRCMWIWWRSDPPLRVKKYLSFALPTLLMSSLHGNVRDPRVNGEFQSQRANNTGFAILFMVTKQTCELPVIWDTGVLVTSLWLRNRCWLIIHWIPWLLIPKPQQCYFHNFGYNVANITHFPRHMKITVTTFPSGITKHEGLIAK